jgi:hypothetical protein
VVPAQIEQSFALPAGTDTPVPISCTGPIEIPPQAAGIARPKVQWRRR